MDLKTEVQNTIWKIYLYEKRVPDHLISQISIISLFEYLDSKVNQDHGADTDKSKNDSILDLGDKDGPERQIASMSGTIESDTGINRSRSSTSRYVNALSKKPAASQRAIKGGPSIAKLIMHQLFSQQIQDSGPSSSKSSSQATMKRTKIYREILHLINNTQSCLNFINFFDCETDNERIFFDQLAKVRSDMDKL